MTTKFAISAAFDDEDEDVSDFIGPDEATELDENENNGPQGLSSHDIFLDIFWTTMDMKQDYAINVYLCVYMRIIQLYSMDIALRIYCEEH